MSPTVTFLAFAGLSLTSWNGAQTGPTGALRAAEAVELGAPPAVHGSLPSLRLELPAQTAFLNGEEVDLGVHEIWRPICSGAEPVTQQGLQGMVAVHKALAQEPVLVVNEGPDLNGFNIVFVASGSIPSGAPAALAAAETYIESFFSDPITITINCSFQPMSPGVLGGTSSSYGYVDYAPSRTQIVGDMDASDTLQSFLPTTSTCPVRYGSNATVTNETRVFFTFANWKAVDGVISGADAAMTFNSSFAFDYDPSNGVGSTYSFVDIVIHETGHAMGFTSGGDFRFKDIEVLDLFRFQRTDGTGDYNPDTTAEFQARARLVAFNKPNEDHNSDLISAEYRMSDGSPYQMSHFREQTTNIGLMDPALAPGETWYPSYYSTADVAMFDAIGYDN